MEGKYDKAPPLPRYPTVIAGSMPRGESMKDKIGDVPNVNLAPPRFPSLVDVDLRKAQAAADALKVPVSAPPTMGGKGVAAAEGEEPEVAVAVPSGEDAKTPPRSAPVLTDGGEEEGEVRMALVGRGESVGRELEKNIQETISRDAVEMGRGAKRAESVKTWTVEDQQNFDRLLESSEAMGIIPDASIFRDVPPGVEYGGVVLVAPGVEGSAKQKADPDAPALGVAASVKPSSDIAARVAALNKVIESSEIPPPRPDGPPPLAYRTSASVQSIPGEGEEEGEGGAEFAVAHSENKDIVPVVIPSSPARDEVENVAVPAAAVAVAAGVAGTAALGLPDESLKEVAQEAAAETAGDISHDIAERIEAESVSVQEAAGSSSPTIADRAKPFGAPVAFDGSERAVEGESVASASAVEASRSFSADATPAKDSADRLIPTDKESPKSSSFIPVPLATIPMTTYEGPNAEPVTAERKIEEAPDSEVAARHELMIRSKSTTAHVNVTDDYGLKGGHAAGVKDAAFFDDSTLVTCGADGKVCIWNLEERYVTAEFTPFEGKTVTMVYPLPEENGSSSRSLITLSEDRVMRIWNLAHNQAVLLRTMQIPSSKNDLVMNIPVITSELKARAAAAAAAAGVTAAVPVGERAVEFKAITGEEKSSSVAATQDPSATPHQDEVTTIEEVKQGGTEPRAPEGTPVRDGATQEAGASDVAHTPNDDMGTPGGKATQEVPDEEAQSPEIATGSQAKKETQEEEPSRRAPEQRSTQEEPRKRFSFVGDLFSGRRRSSTGARKPVAS